MGRQARGDLEQLPPEFFLLKIFSLLSRLGKFTVAAKSQEFYPILWLSREPRLRPYRRCPAAHA